MNVIKNFVNSFILKITDNDVIQVFIKNSIWSFVGAIISKGLLFLSWIIVARILGSYGYGQFGIVRSTVLMFISFAGVSLGITASKFVAEFYETNKIKVSRIIGLTLITGGVLGFIISIIFYFLSPWLALNTLNSPDLVGDLQICAIILFFSSINGAQMGVLQGLLEFKSVARINMIQAVASFPLFILGAYFYDVSGAIIAFLISYVIVCILTYFELKKKCQVNNIIIDYKQSYKESIILFQYSLPAFFAGIVVTPLKWYSDSLLVTKSGFVEMGIFTAALTFNNIILVFAGMISAPLLTLMTKTNSDKNTNIERLNILLPWFASIIISIPLMILFEYSHSIFGDSFPIEQFRQTFIIVLLFTVLMMLKDGLARIIAVNNLQWWSFLSNIIWGLTLLGTLFLFNKFDSFTLAIAYFIAYAVNIVVLLPIYNKKKLIPKKTIGSTLSILIWVVVFTSVYVGLYFENLLFRLVYLLISISVLLLLFKKSFKSV